MKQPTDHDGKSKTASAVDDGHYPEQNEVTNPNNEPTHAQIAARAQELWRKRGCQDGFAERDWLEAERELGAQPHMTAQGESGSVQR